MLSISNIIDTFLYDQLMLLLYLYWDEPFFQHLIVGHWIGAFGVRTGRAHSDLV